MRGPRRIAAWLFAGAFTAGLVLAAAQAGTTSRTASALDAALASITAEESLEHVKYLAGDDLKGRLAGSPEGRRAAEYVAEAFRRAGLKAAGPDGGFFQEFTRSRAGTDPSSRLSLTVGEKTLTLQPQKGFVAFPFSAAGKATAEIVFAGYGITAPEEHYDDYAGLEVKGKVVLALRHEPARGVEGKAFAGKRDTEHSYFATKALNAQRHGAAALLVFSDPVSHGEEPDFLFADRAAGEAALTIPFIQITRAAATEILAAAGKDILEIQREIDRTTEPRSSALAGSSAALDLRIRYDEKHLQNVVAIWPGADESLADQYVVVGAHYDHLGTGEYGARTGKGQVFNGADDNASGTAALMEIAQALGTSGLSLRRSLLLAAFDGEEAGVLGSRHYVEHPLVPLAKTAAMINLDMIGRANPDEVVAMGLETGTGFREMLNRLAAREEVRLRVRGGGGGSGADSDHAPFYFRKVPVLFFFGSMHQDYHTPGDDWQKINSGGLSRIARLALLAAREIADAEAPPTFVPPKPRSERAFLGVGPLQEALPAPVIGEVLERSPAAKAGLKPGDVVLQAEAMAVDRWDDLVTLIGAGKPGDTITLQIRRGEETREVPVKLGSQADRIRPPR